MMFRNKAVGSTNCCDTVIICFFLFRDAAAAIQLVLTGPYWGESTLCQGPTGARARDVSGNAGATFSEAPAVLCTVMDAVCPTTDLVCVWRTMLDLFSSQLQSSPWSWDCKLCLPFRKSHSCSSDLAEFFLKNREWLRRVVIDQAPPDKTSGIWDPTCLLWMWTFIITELVRLAGTSQGH